VILTKFVIVLAVIVGVPQAADCRLPGRNWQAAVDVHGQLRECALHSGLLYRHGLLIDTPTSSRASEHTSAW